MESDLHVEIAARLKRDAQRYTRNRRTLVEILRRANQPLAIPDILRAKRGLPQSSVYRNLTVLERSHVVRRVITGEDFAHFELAEDLTEHHHHLVCSGCGAVEDVRIPPRLERTMEQALDTVASGTGFTAVSHRLDLLGT
ncbi:MAG: transcriptional repressor, partial [Actinomycetota bacterium]|nr:transcriptional repressor [Actinomycetota bacterium]